MKTVINSSYSDEETYDYKSLYEYGLRLLKDSLNEVNITPYRAMLPYFTYPLSVIENEVKMEKKNIIDTNVFYKENSDDLLEIYVRFLQTSLVCQSQLGTDEAKRRANKILNEIQNQSNYQTESLNEKEQSVQQGINKDKNKKILLLKRIRKNR